MLLEGMHLPLTTPFSADGRLNLRKLEQNVRRYSLTPAAGMVALGITGEASLLSEEETRQVLKTALESASPTKVMTAGIFRNSLQETLNLLEYAGVIGYDVALLFPPTLPDLTLAELRTYLQTAADKSPISILLSGNLPLDLVAELALHPNILGFAGIFEGLNDLRNLLEKTASIKRTVTVTQVFAAFTRRMSSEQPAGLVSAESLANGVAATAIKPSLKIREKTVSFQVLTGNTESMLADLKAGAIGAISPFSSAAPQATYEVMAAWKDGDPALADEKQQRLKEAIRLIEGKLGIAGVKYGCDLNGYFGGTPRIPRLPLTGEQKAEIELLMQGLKS